MQCSLLIIIYVNNYLKQVQYFSVMLYSFIGFYDLNLFILKSICIYIYIRDICDHFYSNSSRYSLHLFEQ